MHRIVTSPRRKEEEKEEDKKVGVKPSDAFSWKTISMLNGFLTSHTIFYGAICARGLNIYIAMGEFFMY